MGDLIRRKSTRTPIIHGLCAAVLGLSFQLKINRIPGGPNSTQPYKDPHPPNSTQTSQGPTPSRTHPNNSRPLLLSFVYFRCLPCLGRGHTEKHRKYELFVGYCFPARARKRKQHPTKVHIFNAFRSSRSEARSNKSSYFRCFPWFGRGHTAPDCTGQSVENMNFLLDLLSAGFVNLLP